MILKKSELQQVTRQGLEQTRAAGGKATISHEQSFLGIPALCSVSQCFTRTLVQEFHQRGGEREEWALLSGHIASGTSLCFSINSITSLIEGQTLRVTQRFDGLLV